MTRPIYIEFFTHRFHVSTRIRIHETNETYSEYYICCPQSFLRALDCRTVQELEQLAKEDLKEHQIDRFDEFCYPAYLRIQLAWRYDESGVLSFGDEVREVVFATDKGQQVLTSYFNAKGVTPELSRAVLRKIADEIRCHNYERVMQILSTLKGA